MGINFKLAGIRTLGQVEQEHLEWVMAHFDRNVEEAGFAVGISATQIIERCKKYGISYIKDADRKVREYQLTTTTWIRCEHCQKKYPISTWYYNRRMREGQRNFYCCKNHAKLHHFKLLEEVNKLKYISLRCVECSIDFPRKLASYHHRRAKGQTLFVCSRTCRSVYKKKKLVQRTQEDILAKENMENVVKAFCWYCDKEVEERLYLWSYRTMNSPDRRYFCTNEEERAWRKAHPSAQPVKEKSLEVKVPIEKKVAFQYPMPCAICLQYANKDKLYEARTGLRVFGCSEECIGQIKQRARRAQLGL